MLECFKTRKNIIISTTSSTTFWQFLLNRCPMQPVIFCRINNFKIPITKGGVASTVHAQSSDAVSLLLPSNFPVCPLHILWPHQWADESCMEHSSPNCQPLSSTLSKVHAQVSTWKGKTWKEAILPSWQRSSRVRELPMRLIAEFISEELQAPSWTVKHYQREAIAGEQKVFEKGFRCYTYKHLKPASCNVSWHCHFQEGWKHKPIR